MAYFKCTIGEKQSTNNEFYAEVRSWNADSPISWTAPRTGTVKVFLFEAGRTEGTNMRSITFSFMGKEICAQNYSGNSYDYQSLRTSGIFTVQVTEGTTYASSYTRAGAIMDMYGAAWTYVD